MPRDNLPCERLVVIGNGMAGMRTVEELLSRAPDRYDITVIGAEPHPNYNRIMLSSVLAGEKTVEEIVINPHAWYDENGIRLIAGDSVTAIDRERKDRDARGRHAPPLRQAAARHRVEAAGAADPRAGPARRPRLSRHRRCRADDRRGAAHTAAPS